MRVAGRLLLIAWAAGMAGARPRRAVGSQRSAICTRPAGDRGPLYILAGGQRLRNAAEVYVSGDGVRHGCPGSAACADAEPEQLREARDRLVELRKDPRAAEGAGKAKPPASQPTTRPGDPPELDVSTLSVRELEYLAAFVQSGDKKQLNAQLADVVLIEIVVAPKAAVGDRELRLGAGRVDQPAAFPSGTPAGDLRAGADWAGNAGCVGTQSTVSDQRPDHARGCGPVSLSAQSGQRLVLEVQARSLIPYLADAVPGWFQATLAVYDTAGHELAFADDYRFNPDPVLLFEVPDNGEYQLEIRNALYRGREDFVYRIAVGESPFVTQVFPLGGRSGTLRARRSPGGTCRGIACGWIQKRGRSAFGR